MNEWDQHYFCNSCVSEYSGVKLLMMSMIQCLFCFENCTTEVEKAEGMQILKQSTQDL